MWASRERVAARPSVLAAAVAVALLACSGDAGTACGEGTVEDSGTCVLDRDPAAACGPGTHVSDGVCVADSGPAAFCGPGTLAAGPVCVPSPDPTPWCGPGTRAVAGLCVPDADPSPYCGPGTVASGTLCVFDGNAAAYCGAGTVVSGGVCVPSAAPSSYCGPGTALVGTQCAPTADPAVYCGPGTVLAGGLCVPSVAPVEHCGPGTRLEGGLCVPATDPVLFCGPGTALSGGLCVPTADPAALCGPGTTWQDGVCVPTADPAGACGPGTTFSGGLCVPALDPAEHCGPGTVIAGDVCVPERTAADHCGPGTHLEVDVCVADADPAPWCGAGTYPAGGACVASGANGWQVLLPASRLPAGGGWRLPVRVIAPEGSPPEAVVLALTREGAGTLDPAGVWVDADGGETWLVGCDGAAPGCLGPVRVAAYRAADPATPVAMSDPVDLIAPTGVGTPAPCLVAPNVLFLDGVTWVWKGVAAITLAEFASMTVEPDHLALRVLPADEWATDWWWLDLSTKKLGVPLAVRVYEGARDYPFEPAGSPGFALSGGSRACAPASGRFEIQRLEVSGASLVELLATLEIRCGSDIEPLRACIHYTAR